jgi:uncharacterized protein (DUF4213/DUF364 family)
MEPHTVPTIPPDAGPAAPRPRPAPAAILYGPGAGDVEGLLLRFAADLRARGLRVGGLAQRTERDDAGRKVRMDVLDVAAGTPHDIMQHLGAGSKACSIDTQGLAEASAVLRRALAEGVDLLVVSKFSHLEAEGAGLADELLQAMAAGVPVLTLTPESHALDWLRFSAPAGRLLAPRPADLWRWWGPFGLMAELRAGIPPEATARRVVIGVNWTMVEGPHGVGLAQTPARETAGCRPPPSAGTLTGRPLVELAALAEGADPFGRALGVAALNAAHNRFDLTGSAGNGLDLFAEAAATAERPVMVGAFPKVRERVPHLALIERTAGPDRWPESAAPALLADADAVLLTASTLVNGTLPGLLSACRPGAGVMMVGPGTPLAPFLFDHGATTLAGLVVSDPDGLAGAVAEGVGARGLRRFGRDVVLGADTGAG